ncbi:MAG TPA: hypothetical protein VIJ61_09215 [Thermoanaerobaculia bacterium]
MKKKHMKKLTINRETVRSLDSPKGVFGGATVAPCQTQGLACNPTMIGIRCGDTGTYDTCAQTYGCSTDCTTGGTACTGLTCGC